MASEQPSSPLPTIYHTMMTEQTGNAFHNLPPPSPLNQQYPDRKPSPVSSTASSNISDAPLALTESVAKYSSVVDSSESLNLSEPDYLKLILTARVYDVALITPLQHTPALSAKLGRDNQILLKREDLQPVFSFKCRGAYNRMANLTDEEKRKGVIACSAGNHAQGVALAAQKMGIQALIVMPTATPAIKYRAVERMGGKVLLFGDDFDAAKKECARLQKVHGYVNIPPFDDPYVIAGQGTVGLEILRQTDLEKITTIFCCVGGAGLIAGIGAYVKRIRPEIKIIGVETHDANALTISLQKGERVELEQVGLFADGAAVKLVGKENFRVCKNVVDDMVNVSNDEICAAIKDIFEETRTVMEPAGALSVAGCKKYLAEHPEMQGGVHVCVTSGANMNFDRLRFVAERAELGEQREALISVIIPEKPGSFLNLYEVIHPRNITEFAYRYRDSSRAHVYMSFTVLSPGNREQELKEIFESLASKGMQARDLSDNEMAKTHARYMVGGRSAPKNERLLSFVFPERPGALKRYLNETASTWNISLWHYRNYGSDMARVLVGMQIPPEDEKEFQAFLTRLKFPCTDESNNPVYSEFLYI